MSQSAPFHLRKRMAINAADVVLSARLRTLRKSQKVLLIKIDKSLFSSSHFCNTTSFNSSGKLKIDNVRPGRLIQERKLSYLFFSVGVLIMQNLWKLLSFFTFLDIENHLFSTQPASLLREMSQ